MAEAPGELVTGIVAFAVAILLGIALLAAL